MSAFLTLVLVPVLIVTILVLPLWGILVAALERRRLRLLGLPTLPSGHVHIPRDERRHWLNIRLMEPATWRETASVIAGLILGAIAVVVVFAEAMTLAALIVRVTLSTDDESAVIEAQDDGHGGIDVARGTGLRGLTERADALGGKLRISSPPGGPTVLTLSLPTAAASSNSGTEARRAHSPR